MTCTRSLLTGRSLAALLAGLPLAIGACDGGEAAADPTPATFTVSGTVEGLDGTAGAARPLALSLFMPEAGEQLPARNGPFQFSLRVPAGQPVLVVAPRVDGPAMTSCWIVPPHEAGGAQAASTFWSAALQTRLELTIRCARWHRLQVRVDGASAERPASLRATVEGLGDVLHGWFDAPGRFALGSDARTALAAGMRYEVVSNDGRCRVIDGRGVMPAADVTVAVACGDTLAAGR